MRKTDITKFSEDNSVSTSTSGPVSTGVRSFFSVFWKFFSTILVVFLLSCFVVLISVIVYLWGLSAEGTGIDLHAAKLQLTSFIYIYDEDGDPVEYQSLYNTENRVWVNFEDIPQYMKDAMVAIEDKRFYDHNGVDWVRTMGAVFNLGSGSASYGGSTLTQQLIKNITDDNEVSLNRKLREIFRALNLEREFTKDEILEAYLNVVNYGSGCRGVQAAANLYFGKDIQDCTIAQCAAIAGITQNPAAYTPLEYPENNKERRETVIAAMYDQGKITDAEYDDAMKESDNMTFVGYNNNPTEVDDEKDSDKVGNWYIEAMFRDLRTDLAKELNISEDAASQKLYTEGLKIYSAMDEDMQNYAEQYVLSIDTPGDPNLQLGTVMMDFNGRILATVGSRTEKEGMLVYDRANNAALQPGSSIKPSFVYPMAIDQGDLNFSSYVKDEAIKEWRYENGTWYPGPNNWYGYYKGEILLPDAIEMSSNGTAVQTMQNIVGVKNAYNQAINKTGFTHLKPADAENIGGLSIGGLNGGTTVREMTASYQYMGNGGKWYKPYTYYYVTDRDNNVILDNRENIPIQSYSESTATIMNRLLHYNVTYSHSTPAKNSRISGWDIIGKTGTTDADYDSWFVGCSPYAICGVWTGFDTPATISNTGVSVNTFQKLMSHYLSDKDSKEFTLSDTCTPIQYCSQTGKLATQYCSSTYTGYYTEDNRPEYCSGYHGYSSYNYSSSSSNNYYNNYYSNDYSNDYNYSSSNSYDAGSSSSSQSNYDYNTSSGAGSAVVPDAAGGSSSAGGGAAESVPAVPDNQAVQ